MFEGGKKVDTLKNTTYNIMVLFAQKASPIFN